MNDAANAASGTAGDAGDAVHLQDVAQRVVGQLHQAGIPAGLTGGIAIRICSASATREPYRRDYHDIDLVLRSRDTRKASRILQDAGWTGDERFNALNAETQMMFENRRDGVHMDVFIDRLRMCHTLDLRDSVDTERTTVPPADLLLGKLQIVEINAKDRTDIAALLSDHPLIEPGPQGENAGIELRRITKVCGSDWGWWRTCGQTLDDLIPWAGTTLPETDREVVQSQARLIREAIDAAPKSPRWKVRSKLGDKVRWYETPEEPGG